VGELERPILGELNPPKTLRFHGGTKKLPPRGLGGALMVVLENDKSEK
jgi:hypothetical protein